MGLGVLDTNWLCKDRTTHAPILERQLSQEQREEKAAKKTKKKGKKHKVKKQR